MNKTILRIAVILALCLALTACDGLGSITKPGTAGTEVGSEMRNTEHYREPEQLAEIMIQGEYEQIYAQMSAEFRKEISLKDLEKVGKEFNKGVQGYELMATSPFGTETQYIWVDTSGTKGLTAIFNEDHIITGLLIQPLSVYPETDEVYTKNEFVMPITDTWYVYWGGTNEMLNYHYAHESQRYAYDLIKLKDGKTYDGDEHKNESYYAYGPEIVAPADGTVVEVENNIPDNEPVGAMNQKQPLGNYVIIDHGHQEYSVIAHLKRGTVNVKAGDEVKLGQKLGLSGNSGNSSEAHIHFHVQDSPDPYTAKSIRIRFATGMNPDPIKGQYVEPMIP